ncbi:Por secretion system C-terminal sorting domain-containing protein [Flavobacterium akiainvivens]|nr:Por secretion system C-terminal sorting domain-containing protein [Flavobacterium akiainvivens]
MLFGTASALAQVANPHNATAVSGGAERVASFTVSDATNDRLEIANGTQNADKFNPTIWSYKTSDNTYALAITTAISSATDNGTSPTMLFTTGRASAFNSGAPGTGGFAWGDTSPIVNRPAFEFRNDSQRILTMLANGNTGIGTTAPTARLHTVGAVRFQDIPTISNTYVLTADVNGNVSRQLASSFSGGGLTSSCTTANYLTKNGTSGLTCSQIFDNGTSIGLGTSSGFAYNTAGLATTTGGYTTGTLKLNIAGVARGNVFISTSDASYKQDVAPIEDALETVLKLKGVTYKWDTASFPAMEFDAGDHSGLIAQQVEEVLPHLVYAVGETADDKKAKKSVNYIEIIPYLIEAIRIQQTQIEDLQNQLVANNFQRLGDFVNFENTKIINVSPNPSSDVIAVSMNIEEAVGEARLVVYDLKGAVLSSLTVKERGYDISKSFQKDNFGTGTYIVSLFVNGKSLDSKKFIFN